jgi:lipid-binding SYLF domain-containing protein
MNIARFPLAALVLFASLLMAAPSLRAQSAEEINVEVTHALRKLYANNAIARALGQKAVAVLVFPSIVKAGFVFAAQYGRGALVEDGVIVGYYSTGGGSAGFQAGGAQYGYALFFMNEAALRYFKKTKGWSVGAGPQFVLVDEGFAKEFSTDTARGDIYGIVFNQKGAFGGVGIQGSKISKITLD